MKRRCYFIWLMGIVILFIIGLCVKMYEDKGKSASQVQVVAIREVEKEFVQYKEIWEGTTFPTLSVRDKEEQTIVFTSELKKPKLYVMWASWCSDCQRELPVIEKIYRTYKDDIDFVLIDLVGFRDETVEKALNYYNDNKFTFPIYFDVDQTVVNSLELKAIPTLYFVNSNNQIEKIFIETVDEDSLNREISKLANS
ncbi:TPA: TlpA family protein disulfide reductase [Streptococcus suis]|uniref:Thioredoxin signature protein n=3 Tax=Streptococcus suis TaxID=1307 RepID=A0AAN2RLH9_STRSU|nr:TlpA disulfide reductase family protein [Streptococcus suis]MDE1693999.1 TlpA disulfide reductase family protein [Streptococcus suis]NQH74781.1 TlpA family protein disulfide reductase [Streptococcus suis]NQO74841.1 TlpA family protein disulfide reductase [Streptococcus suis]NQP40243.1 TlpA family protein disulfide reductase [Streptococcus suis]TQE85416.1 TlpA family protein disulfide reductase [Streptococcus suis]